MLVPPHSSMTVYSVQCTVYNVGYHVVKLSAVTEEMVQRR